jgi:hypothetical protein
VLQCKAELRQQYLLIPGWEKSNFQGGAISNVGVANLEIYDSTFQGNIADRKVRSPQAVLITFLECVPIIFPVGQSNF